MEGKPKATIMTRDGKIVQGTRLSQSEANFFEKSVTVERGWIPHWITCKDSDFFRKKQKKRKKKKK